MTYEGVGLPICWKVLGDKRGNSSQEERIGLLEAFRRNFGEGMVDTLTADREFVGQEWLAYLAYHRIKYFIRVRNNMHITLRDGKRVKAHWLMRPQAVGCTYFHPHIVRMGGELLYYSGLKYIGQGGKLDYLILVSYHHEELSMDIYRHRWQIETMFKAFKTSGFNMEDTHVKDADRMDTLIKAMALAFIWAYNAGIYLHEKVKPIIVKKHGRRAVSLFTYGLDYLTETLVNFIDNQIDKLTLRNDKI